MAIKPKISPTDTCCPVRPHKIWNRGQSERPEWVLYLHPNRFEDMHDPDFLPVSNIETPSQKQAHVDAMNDRRWIIDGKTGFTGLNNDVQLDERREDMYREMLRGEMIFPYITFGLEESDTVRRKTHIDIVGCIEIVKLIRHFASETNNWDKDKLVVIIPSSVCTDAR